MQKSQSWLMMVVAPAVMLRKVQELFRTFFCPVTIVGMLSLMTAKMAATILSLSANALIIALEDIKKGQKVNQDGRPGKLGGLAEPLLSTAY